MTRPIYIFDLDGTLSNADHRKHLLTDVEDSTRWRRFYAACGGDSPVGAVIAMFNLLRLTGNDVMIWTGRSDEVAAITVDWLASNTSLMTHDVPSVSACARLPTTRPTTSSRSAGWTKCTGRTAAASSRCSRIAPAWSPCGALPESRASKLQTAIFEWTPFANCVYGIGEKCCRIGKRRSVTKPTSKHGMLSTTRHTQITTPPTRRKTRTR